jgi:hypothetical protein
VTTKVTPIAQCVIDRGASNTAGRYLARWSYSNPGAVALAIRAVPGVENTFTASPALRGQPEIFLSGRQNNVFTTTFSSGAQVWQLNGTNATAKASTQPC